MDSSIHSVFGADTGGTFTDIVYFGPRGIALHKVPSTPDAPQTAIVHGIRDMLGDRGWPSPAKLVHGTTVATNTLLQRQGAKILFVTNTGFQDIPEIGRQNREILYSLKPSRPAPVVPPELCLGLVPRCILKDEDLPAILDTIEDHIQRHRIEAVAVCLLDAFEDPANERILGDALATRTGLPISLSHQVHPRHREYERSCTTLVNAYVQPVMQTYIRQLVHEVRKENARLEIMGSHGGTLRPDEVEEYPYLTLLSGPSAGVAAAISLGSGIGINNIITFDMGGTSTDVCLIRNGLPSFRNQAELSGIPVLGRMIDIHTVGAGGGSIARFDAGGALRVGPQSAGARPGPAAYGHGGPFTVSDAHFITGTLPGSNLLNGAFPVFTDRARAAAEALADQQPAQCHLEPMQIAEGVIQLANQIMAGAIRKISVERGYDPDDFTLCAFGGAGGLHACDLADSLGMKRVWFPPHPGLFSAIGMALCRRRRVWTHSILEDSNDQQFSGFEARIGDLWKQALAEADEAGIPLSAISLEGVLGMRYRGQAFELEIPYSKDFLEQFHENHQRRFGWSDPTKTVQLIYLHLVASGPEPEWREAFETSRSGQTANVEKPTRTMVFRRGMYTESDCIQREALCPGETRTGAIIIQEYSGTLWIPPGWKIISKPGNHLIAEKNASPREN